MLSVRVPNEVEARLTLLARNTGRSKSFYVREALLAHIDDLEVLEGQMVHVSANAERGRNRAKVRKD